jgi:hypothetical protein
MMKNAYIDCLDLTSVWWRRRPVCTCGRTAVAAEETGSRGVDGGKGEQQSRK